MIVINQDRDKVMSYSQKMISIQTSDKFQLDGLLARPDQDDKIENNKTIIIMIHGLTMNFYNPFFISLLPYLTEHGYSVLLANNRGHDLFTTRHSFQQKRGAIWETFQDSILDITAIIELARSLDYENVVLSGHSMGGLKVIYFQSQIQQEIVKSIILISPVISMKGIYRFRLGDKFNRIVNKAKESVQKGYNDSLFSIYPVWPYTLSAKTIVSFMSDESEANIYRHIGKIKNPILVLLDDYERDYDLRKKAINSNRIDMLRIEGADHFYNGFEKLVADSMLRWLNEVYTPH